jgi:retron-type reverse transcriptase
MRPVAAFSSWDLPVIETVGSLAEWLALTTDKLDWFANRQGFSQHYYYRVLAKDASRIRIIEASKPRLKALQGQILTAILEKIPPHPAAHGFLKGRSIKTFIAPHVGQRTVLRMDLKDFFPSIGRARISACFRTMGYPDSVATYLAALCTNIVPNSGNLYSRPHLPQGAPSSPALANLCVYRADCRLHGLAAAAGANYTRYADDLAFSGNLNFEFFSLRAAAILLEEGFEVHHRKTRIMHGGVRQYLAGLIANQHMNVMRPDFDCLKAILTNCIRHGPTSQNRAAHPDFRAHLQGRIAFVESINPARGQRLRTLFENIQWP